MILEQSQTIVTTITLQLQPGAGFSTDHKAVFDVMNDFRDDFSSMQEITGLYLESQSDIDNFDNISYRYIGKVSDFIDEHVKSLHAIAIEDLNLYLQTFFNYLLDQLEPSNIEYEMFLMSHDFSYCLMEWFVSTWVYEQRHSDYSNVQRVNTKMDEIIKKIHERSKRVESQNVSEL